MRRLYLFKSFFIALSVVCVLGVFNPKLSYAQTITQLQELSFGQAIVADNRQFRDITVAPDGSFSSDSRIYILVNPEPGIYRLSGAGAMQTIASVNITIDQQMIGPGEDFVLGNFTVDHPPQTDASGEAIINVGARMRTTGSLTNYQSSSLFNGVLTIEVNLL